MHHYANCYGVQVGEPVRRKESEFRNEVSVRNAVRIALSQPECAAVLLLFDGEDDCPAERSKQVGAWAQSEAGTVPCEVVLAYREYETWFLASLESLRGSCRIRDDAIAPADPESRRDAKGALEAFMPSGTSYSPTIHQQKLSAVFDLALAHQRNRSFRKLTKAVGVLLRGLQQPLPAWPPDGW